MKKDTYLVQAKRRIKDIQVGGLLEAIYELEQILTCNTGQFFIFYKKWMGVELPNTLTLEEVNSLKIHIIKIQMEKIIETINKNPQSFSKEEYEKR